MTGFGLYEALRILLPGGFGITVLSLVLRLAGDSGAHFSGGVFAPLVGALQGAPFLFAALVLGLLLYLLDLPTRARLYTGGDPARDAEPPSVRLRELVGDADLKQRSLSLYFILSDAHMPEEFHRRVYFFGGTYRTFFDARLLAAAGMIIGGPLALTLHGATLGAGAHYLAAAAVAAAIVPVLLVGEQGHRIRRLRAATQRRRTDHDPLAAYRLERRTEVVELGWTLLALLCLGTAAFFLSAAGPVLVRALGLGAAVGSLFIWGMTELGPPVPQDGVGQARPTNARFGSREATMAVLRLPAKPRPQYWPLQRGLLDLAAFTPPLAAAAAAAAAAGRPPVAVLLWGLPAVSATLIMSVRKHEERLITNYRDQNAWLELNRAKLATLSPAHLSTDTWA